MVISPFVIVGMGRSGTSVIADVLGCHPDLLLVDEPNIFTALLIPYWKGDRDLPSVQASIDDEGWRGAVKICRTLSLSYPHLFGDSGISPIRSCVKRMIGELDTRGSSGDSTDRFNRVCIASNRLIDLTLRVADRKRWLVKQPNAVLAIEDLLAIWPDLRAIHVSRELPYVLMSRLTKGFQSTFEEALHVCWSRAKAASTLDALIGTDRVCHVRIEDIAEHPEQYMRHLLCFLELPESRKVISACREITHDRLVSIGNPRSFFTREQINAIGSIQRRAKELFGREMM